MNEEGLNLEIVKSFNLRVPHKHSGIPVAVPGVRGFVCCGEVLIYICTNGLLGFDVESLKFICRAKEFANGYKIEDIIKWNENTFIVGGKEPRFCLCSFCVVGKEMKIEKNFTNLTRLSGNDKCHRILKISEERFCFETKKQLEIVDYKSGKVLYKVSSHLESADSFSRMLVSLKYENSFYFTNYRTSKSSTDIIKHVRYTDNEILGRYGFESEEEEQIYDLQLYKNKRDQEILIIVISNGIVMALSDANGGERMPRELFKLGLRKDQYVGTLHILHNFLMIGTNEGKLLISDIERFSTHQSSPIFDEKREDRSKELEIKEFQISSGPKKEQVTYVVGVFERDGQRINYSKGGFLFVIHGENMTKIKVSGLKDSSFFLGLEDLKERISFLFDLEGITPDDIFFGSKDQKNLFIEIDCNGKFKCLKIFLL